ncbi:MAG: Gfo/Idh/MocA family protein [Solirubrobacteraceae bacterium]
MLRAAVIGLGAIGRHHARVLQASPRVELVGAVDPLGDRFGAMAEPADVFGSIDELLDARAVDLALVATPAMTHASVAIALARAGVHVLVEKPMAATCSEAEAMVRACEEAGVCGAVGHVERCNPALVEAHRLVREDRIGPIVRIASERLGSGPEGTRDVGVVRDLITHDLDIVRWIAAGPLGHIVAATSTTPDGAALEDHAVVSGTVIGGPRFSCVAGWQGAQKRRRVTVTGELGVVRADTITLEVRCVPNGGRSTSVVLQHQEEPFVVQLHAFCDYVEGRVDRPLVSLAEGWEALSYAEAALACAS